MLHNRCHIFPQRSNHLHRRRKTCLSGRVVPLNLDDFIPSWKYASEHYLITHNRETPYMYFLDQILEDIFDCARMLEAISKEEEETSLELATPVANFSVLWSLNEPKQGLAQRHLFLHPLFCRPCISASHIQTQKTLFHTWDHI